MDPEPRSVVEPESITRPGLGLGLPLRWDSPPHSGSNLLSRVLLPCGPFAWEIPGRLLLRRRLRHCPRLCWWQCRDGLSRKDRRAFP